MPFGMGPRNCIGMRFALMEAKMALLSILRRFKYERSPDTEVHGGHYCYASNHVVKNGSIISASGYLSVFYLYINYRFLSRPD